MMPLCKGPPAQEHFLLRVLQLSFLPAHPGLLAQGYNQALHAMFLRKYEDIVNDYSAVLLVKHLS